MRRIIKKMFSWYDPKPKQEEKPTNMPRPQQPPYLLQFFAYSHLPPSLQQISAHFHELAHTLSKKMPNNPEMEVALRKLLEAKDCSVRAALLSQSFEQAQRVFNECEAAKAEVTINENKTKG